MTFLKLIIIASVFVFSNSYAETRRCPVCSTPTTAVKRIELPTPKLDAQGQKLKPVSGSEVNKATVKRNEGLVASRDLQVKDVGSQQLENNISKKVVTQFERKTEKQMGKRGWDKDSINGTIDNPARTVTTRDTRWRNDGTRRDDPATAYIRTDGHYVVRNDNDGTIVQISDRKKTDWKPPFE